MFLLENRILKIAVFDLWVHRWKWGLCGRLQRSIGSTDRWCYFLATPSGDLAILIALETLKHIPFWFLVHI